MNKTVRTARTISLKLMDNKLKKKELKLIKKLKKAVQKQNDKKIEKLREELLNLRAIEKTEKLKKNPKLGAK